MHWRIPTPSSWRRAHPTTHQGKEDVFQEKYSDCAIVREPASAIAHRPKKRVLGALRKGARRVLVEWPQLGRRTARAAFAAGVRNGAAAVGAADGTADGLRVTFHGVTAVGGVDQVYWNFISRRASLFAAGRGADVGSEPSFESALVARCWRSRRVARASRRV